ncbi:MAG: hypothetical protein AAB250_06775, partial [Bdellovibrionota bacterium]
MFSRGRSIFLLIALVGAMALACFVKACGVAFLGMPRSSAAQHAHEAHPAMRASPPRSSAARCTP